LKRCLIVVQKRWFQARVIKEPALPPPYVVKKAFDYSNSEPIKNLEKAVVDIGANYEKHNDLFEHYNNQELFMNDETNFGSYYSGMYGEYWCANHGAGMLKFLKRRTTQPGVYRHKWPIINWYRRKLDERGLIWEFPRGQDYQIVAKWLTYAFFGGVVAKQLLNISKHRNNHKPLPESDNYPPRINLPFYVYILHSIPSPNFEIY